MWLHFDFFPHYFQAKNIKNKPIINRDIQSIRFEEMQTEIKVTYSVLLDAL